MKIVDANASVIPKPGETAILCMFMTQKTAKPVPIVRLCAIGQVKPGLRWLCTLEVMVSHVIPHSTKTQIWDRGIMNRSDWALITA